MKWIRKNIYKDHCEKNHRYLIVYKCKNWNPDFFEYYDQIRRAIESFCYDFTVEKADFDFSDPEDIKFVFQGIYKGSSPLLWIIVAGISGTLLLVGVSLAFHKAYELVSAGKVPLTIFGIFGCIFIIYLMVRGSKG